MFSNIITKIFGPPSSFGGVPTFTVEEAERNLPPCIKNLDNDPLLQRMAVGNLQGEATEDEVYAGVMSLASVFDEEEDDGRGCTSE